jgi:hypothetical protein
MPPTDLLKPLQQQRVTIGRFGELQFRGGWLQVFAQKGSVVPVARGVDADADAHGRRRAGLRERPLVSAFSQLRSVFAVW